VNGSGIELHSQCKFLPCQKILDDGESVTLRHYHLDYKATIHQSGASKCLPYKHETWVELFDREKQTGLLLVGVTYTCEKFYTACPNVTVLSFFVNISCSTVFC
jgi:hypothetical protein